MSNKKDIKEILKLLEIFLTDGRSFCFQAQSQCNYFNMSLSPQPGAVRKNTQYYHATELSEMVVKIKYMIENGRHPSDGNLTTKKEIEKEKMKKEEEEESMEDLL